MNEPSSNRLPAVASALNGRLPWLFAIVARCGLAWAGTTDAQLVAESIGYCVAIILIHTVVEA